MVVQGEAVALLGWLMVVPMFLGSLLGGIGSILAPKVGDLFGKLFGGGGDDAGDIFGSIMQMLSAGSAPDAGDLLADNPHLQAFLDAIGVQSADTDREFEGLRGRASDLENRRAANLSQTGLAPSGIADVEGLEFLAPLIEQFAGVDPTLGAAALGLNDQERLIGQQLALKQALLGQGLNASTNLSSMLIPAQSQFAAAAGQGVADRGAAQGNQDVIMQFLQALGQGGGNDPFDDIMQTLGFLFNQNPQLQAPTGISGRAPSLGGN